MGDTSMIRPVVEFFQLDPVLSKQKKNYELFPTGDDASVYNNGLRDALEGANGVYVFFDSRGQGVYAGQASRQNLWKEARSSFNKDLGTNKTRKINLVSHPSTAAYKPWKEKQRSIAPTDVKISDLAVYFSAYEVSKEQIDDVEALLIRVFTNSLINLANPKFGKYEQKMRRRH